MRHLTGLGRLSRALTRRPWAPVLTLASVTLVYDTAPYWGDVRLGLPVLTGGPGRPSALAIGVTFWAWALTVARVRDRARVRFVGPGGLRGYGGYAGLGVLYGVVLLADPAVGVWAGAGAVALVAGGQRGWRGAVAARWGVTVAVALVVAGCRPYTEPPSSARAERPYAACSRYSMTRVTSMLPRVALE